MLQLRDYQGTAVGAMLEFLYRNEEGAPLCAMPTGTGKSLVIAGMVTQIAKQYPLARQMMLTHVKELITQNANKLLEFWPEAPVGIYSAQLRQKQTNYPITFGGIGSVRNAVDKFGHIDVLYIDECHLVGPDDAASYQKVIKALTAANPRLRVCGFTATDFRMGVGKLTDDHEGRIFTECAVDMTGVDWFNWFCMAGFLVPPVPRPTETNFDLSGVKTTGGDYNAKQLQTAVDRYDVTNRALQEAIKYGEGRRSWIAFCAGVEHAIHVAEQLRAMGVPTACVHSDMAVAERDEQINGFRQGRYRCITNNGILTTGFDHPPLDMMLMLRPTKSAGLWVQMLGRGTRPAPGKRNCLVLDFAGNTRRLGPINDPVIPRRKGPGTGEIPVKTCPECGVFNHLSARHCVECGCDFDIRPGITALPKNDQLVRVDAAPVVERFEVMETIYSAYRNRFKADAKPMLRVSYIVRGGQEYMEHLLFEHEKPLVRHRAREWWRQRWPSEGNDTAPASFEPYVPETAADAALYAPYLKRPRAIRVHTNKSPYPEVVAHEF